MPWCRLSGPRHNNKLGIPHVRRLQQRRLWCLGGRLHECCMASQGQLLVFCLLRIAALGCKRKVRQIWLCAARHMLGRQTMPPAVHACLPLYLQLHTASACSLTR